MSNKPEHTLPVDEGEFLEHIRTLHLPRYAELPPIDLYMDQTLTYIEDQLRPLIPADEKLITSSMVNNYVKQHVLPTPRRKRYTRDHVAYLIAICLLKRTFSMEDIQRLLETQSATHEMESAYDFFCAAMEESLRILFCGVTASDSIGTWELASTNGFSFSLDVADAGELTPERRMALSAITCAANKIYVEKCFEFDIPTVAEGGNGAGASARESGPAAESERRE